MQAIDNALLRVFVDAGQDSPLLLKAASVVTDLGGSAWLVPLTLIIAGWLVLRSHHRRALALLLITFGGRAAVELLKWLMDRPRPFLVDYDIVVHSMSFPSGHAANSMIVYLALALLAAPVLWRRWPIAGAMLAVALIGMTRPLLGVHWPTDVLAGWALGIAWTLTAVRLLSPWMEGRPRGRPSPL